MIHVTFRNVGRHKRTWEATMRTLSEASLLRTIKLNGDLLSREISVGLSADGKTGMVFAGMRNVGSFEYKEGETPDDTDDQS